MKTRKEEVFLLTKPPGSSRSELCLSLIARAVEEGNPASLYLAADGVYHLLGENLPACKVYACKEDLEARGIRVEGIGIEKKGAEEKKIERKGAERNRAGEELTIPKAFYETFLDDIMEHCKKVYTF